MAEMLIQHIENKNLLYSTAYYHTYYLNLDPIEIELDWKEDHD
jgi:hypothetical protein